ncbi:hypothetical protein A3A21_00330 [Candidatus Jorgensenbacteria bacterium RIFCSPLOWO2_01_FULL_45_25b]|uniref:Beta-lactamase-related domain-containing protein n=1 Tax=Candidatus Jorgensenbacteria bacterium RIFCSPLOWO2_01_FULL_45_25b TaxID=1798471 RepID=A0A1F6BV29_9BACT|nr:MAG: hypothetical protein A3A21_00330 [Candidatus Jorgensenbacteria bacterium RIFCSPLOWO2_01_FULL_45_25b]
MEIEILTEKIRERVRLAIQEGVFPGCVVGVVTKTGERFVLPVGRFTYDECSPLVMADSIFDIASVTKAIPVASLALWLIDRGRLSLGDFIVSFLPELRGEHWKEVTLWHLLTYTLNLQYEGRKLRLSSYAQASPLEILNIIFSSEFRSKPGRVFSYSNAVAVLLGLVIERVAERSMDELAKEVFFSSLQMSRTTFQPLSFFARDEIVPTEFQNGRGLAHGEVHDESAYALSKGGVAGSAGLFSTAPNLLTFLEMLLRGGEFGGYRYFSEEAVSAMYTNQLQEIGEAQGLGFQIYQPKCTPLEITHSGNSSSAQAHARFLTGWMGERCLPNTFGKTGFTGCSVICDPNQGVGVVMLSNAVYPKRKSDFGGINAFRRDIHDIVLTALMQ